MVREAVTNVVRHSDASMCTVTVGHSWVEVGDNGSGRARMALAASVAVFVDSPSGSRLWAAR